MNDIELIMKANRFASVKHQNQRRKDAAKTPYINHPIDVANLISSSGVTDPNIICAALLHDTIEDTGTKYEEIEKEFGSKIASIVTEVTDDKCLSKVERKMLQIDHANNVSYEAKTVKLADKLSNLTDLSKESPQGWSPEIVKGYYIWSYFVIRKLSGTNKILEKALDDLLLPVINSVTDLDAELSHYYDLLK